MVKKEANLISAAKNENDRKLTEITEKLELLESKPKECANTECQNLNAGIYENCRDISIIKILHRKLLSNTISTHNVNSKFHRLVKESRI